MRRPLVLSAALTLLLMTLGTTAPAHATFPGANGRLAYIFQKRHVWQLFTMNPDGTQIRQLTHFTDRSAELWDVDWSPDGTKIAFSGNPSGDWEVWRVNADGSDLTNLTNDPKADDGNPRWSPDGTQVLFVRRALGSDLVSIFRIGADGNGMTRLTRSAFQETENATYSVDGGRIAFEAFGAAGGICEIWTMKPDGRHKELLVDPAARLYLWDFSPDGRHVLVGNNCAGPLPQALFQMNLDGTALKRLTHPGKCSQDIVATYSPDGTHIVFMSNRIQCGFADGTPVEIYVMDAAGENLVQVTSSGHFHSVDWGPAQSSQRR